LARSLHQCPGRLSPQHPITPHNAL
jgi:hypothetical protein